MPAPSVHRSTVVAVHRLADQCQRIAETLVSGSRPDSAFAGDLADLLAEPAAVKEYGDSGEWSAETRDRLHAVLDSVRDRHGGLTGDVRRGELPTPDSWSVQGGLLLAVERAALALLGAAGPR